MPCSPAQIKQCSAELASALALRLEPFGGSPGVGRRTPTLPEAEAGQGVLRNGRFGSAGSGEPLSWAPAAALPQPADREQ